MQIFSNRDYLFNCSIKLISYLIIIVTVHMYICAF